MKIMLAYDGSDAAKEASELAHKHAKAFNGSVYIVTSLGSSHDVPKKDFEAAEQDLNSAENLLKENNITCETHLLVHGLSPGEDLVQFAEANQIDEIILGVRERSKVGKLLLGSTAHYVIMKAPCPVVTIR